MILKGTFVPPITNILLRSINLNKNNLINLDNKALLPKIAKPAPKTSRLYMSTVKNKATFRSQSNLPHGMMMPQSVSPSPIHHFFKKKKSKAVSLKRRKKMTKSKKAFLKYLKEFMEKRKNRKFGNVDINDVRALRASCKQNSEEITEYTDSDMLSDGSQDSVKGLKPPTAIQIGNLEDKAVAELRQIFQREKSTKKRDESEPYDNFLKNCRIKKIVPSPMGIVKQSRETNEVIKLNEYKIGDDYASVFANTFRKTKQKIIHLNMRNNKLEDGGAKAIIANLNEYIVTIDFSWNQKMSLGAYELLGQKINSTFFRLKKISLDHSNISKRALSAL